MRGVQLQGALADLLLPYALVDDGILLQQDGSLVVGWSFQGPDMMAASPSEMSALSARLNQCLRLGSGWMVHCDAIRSQAPGYPQQGAFEDPITHLIDDERRQQFLQEGAHYESEYFLVLTYLPPIEAEERAKGWLFDGGATGSRIKPGSQGLDRFRGKSTALKTSSAHCSRLAASERNRLPMSLGLNTISTLYWPI